MTIIEQYPSSYGSECKDEIITDQVQNRIEKKKNANRSNLNTRRRLRGWVKSLELSQEFSTVCDRKFHLHEGLRFGIVYICTLKMFSDEKGYVSCFAHNSIKHRSKFSCCL